MTITDLVDNLNASYNDIDDLTHIPRDIRIEISTKLEEIMDKLDWCLDEYGDDPDDNEESYEDDDYDEEYE